MLGRAEDLEACARAQNKLELTAVEVVAFVVDVLLDLGGDGAV